MLPLLQHLLTPGDHYSPSTGSAVVTVAHNLCREQSRAGGHSTVAVSSSSYTDRYPDGQVVEYTPTAGLPDRRQRLRGAALGALGRTRSAWLDPWRPAVATLRPEGAAIAHNGAQVGGLVPSGATRVLYVHNALLRSYTPWEARKSLGRFDVVVAVSSYLADTMSQRAGRRTRVMVVPNGVDPQVFRPGDRRSLGCLQILFLGRVIPEKGVHLIIQAALRLRHLDFVVDIVGNQGFSSALPLSLYEKQLRRAAESLGDRVRFRPFVPRGLVPDALRQADIIVVPSLVREGMPLTLLEGMASGVACVGTDAGGLPEAAGQAARLFPRGDVDALTRILEELLSDEITRNRVAADCLNRARTFTWTASHATLLEALRG